MVRVIVYVRGESRCTSCCCDAALPDRRPTAVAVRLPSLFFFSSFTLPLFAWMLFTINPYWTAQIPYTNLNWFVPKNMSAVGPKGVNLDIFGFYTAWAAGDNRLSLRHLPSAAPTWPRRTGSAPSTSTGYSGLLQANPTRATARTAQLTVFRRSSPCTKDWARESWRTC